ncbi:hypothetical protein KY285_021154 [Solanum tuberosum]|nr:hypothetical protein KY285_021154 [Solanum tuberosum]
MKERRLPFFGQRTDETSRGTRLLPHKHDPDSEKKPRTGKEDRARAAFLCSNRTTERDVREMSLTPLDCRFRVDLLDWVDLIHWLSRWATARSGLLFVSGL